MRGLPLPLCYLALLFGSAEFLLQLGSAHPGGHPACSAFNTVLASDDLNVCERKHALRDDVLWPKARNIETLYALAHFARQGQGSGVRTSSYVSGPASKVLYVCERKRVQLRKDDGLRPKARNVETMYALEHFVRKRKGAVCAPSPTRRAASRRCLHRCPSRASIGAVCAPTPTRQAVSRRCPR